MTDFDWHREMTEGVAEAPASYPDHLVWIITDEGREAYRLLQVNAGFEPHTENSFGVPIQGGAPADGKPFELRARQPH